MEEKLTIVSFRENIPIALSIKNAVTLYGIFNLKCLIKSSSVLISLYLNEVNVSKHVPEQFSSTKM
jgi:hypothetical protein